LIDAHQRGTSVKEFAAAHSIHRATVTDHLRGNGIRTRSDPMRWTREPLEEATDPYGAGDSVRVLGERYGLDPSRVAERLKRAGVKRRPRRGSA
jgi:hypothetical protein